MKQRALHLAYAAVVVHVRAHQLLGTEAAQGLSLTNREREVLSLSALGMTTREVGSALGISVSGVNFHIANAARKLGAHNRTHATSLAIDAGLIAV
ncbi:response regulator transcription factor [Roseospira marina]|uniref:Response regulator transcription factor n=2 Tax=Roseospira marina TaxID=140057 RepID=A0A5M6ICB9_9PROT|nr:response regulator transcription factor [Roseospira marina]